MTIYLRNGKVHIIAHDLDFLAAVFCLHASTLSMVGVLNSYLCGFFLNLLILPSFLFNTNFLDLYWISFKVLNLNIRVTGLKRPIENSMVKARC